MSIVEKMALKNKITMLTDTPWLGGIFPFSLVCGLVNGRFWNQDAWVKTSILAFSTIIISLTLVGAYEVYTSKLSLAKIVVIRTFANTMTTSAAISALITIMFALEQDREKMVAGLLAFFITFFLAGAGFKAFTWELDHLIKSQKPGTLPSLELATTRPLGRDLQNSLRLLT